jgi:UDPglucose 6-dehydrogenase
VVPDKVGGRTKLNVTVIGTGYVGTVTAACLAWLGNQVNGLEKDALRQAQLSAGQVPFLEPGLPVLLRDALRAGTLQFTQDPDEALTAAEIVMICVGTPPGRGGLPDLTQVEEAIRTIAPRLQEGSVVANKSTVPVGSANLVRSLVEEERRGRDGRFWVVSNPEFLSEGSAIGDFLHPDRVVIGGDRHGVDRLLELYRPIIDQSFPGGRTSESPEIFTTDLPSAEMIKYAANAFLATKISFANEIANLCELMGADTRQVLPAIGADRRIGQAFLGPGAGWGGSCLPKDVAALIAMGEENKYAAPLLRAAVEVNQRQRASLLEKLERELEHLDGRRVALFGLSFKPHTDDLREAPALEVIGELLQRDALVSAYDPSVKALPDRLADVRLMSNPYDAADGADAVVLMTEWPDFERLDFELLAARMHGDLFLDGRNFIDPQMAAGSGLRVVGIGWNV